MKIKQHLVKMFPLIGIWETCLLNECSSVSWCNDNNHIKMSNSICEALTSQHLKRCQQQEKTWEWIGKFYNDLNIFSICLLSWNISITYWHMVDGWKPRVNLEVSWGFSFPQNWKSSDSDIMTKNFPKNWRKKHQIQISGHKTFPRTENHHHWDSSIGLGGKNIISDER